MMRFGLILLLLAACEPTAYVEAPAPAALFFEVQQAYSSHDGYSAMFTRVGTATHTDQNGNQVEGYMFEDEDGNKVFVPDGQSNDTFNGITVSGGGTPVQSVTGKPCPEPEPEDEEVS